MQEPIVKVIFYTKSMEPFYIWSLKKFLGHVKNRKIPQTPFVKKGGASPGQGFVVLSRFLKQLY